MTSPEIFSPDTLAQPGGAYSHVARVPADASLVVVAGQISADASGAIVGIGDFEQQCAQAYANVGGALRAAGADWSNVVQFMTFLTRRQDAAALGAWRQREFPRLFAGGAYPPNTLLIVSGLAHEELLIEVQAIAAL